MTIHHKIMRKDHLCSIGINGITKDPETDKYMVVLDYASGGNLRDHLKNNLNTITWEKKFKYLWKISYNFKRLHELNIVHQDLHPGNILFENDSSDKFDLVISDFGLSKIVGQNSANPEKRTISGVLPYIAPEVLCGEEYTKSAEVYSFSMIAYEIITGLAPYSDRPHDLELALQICNGLRLKIPFHIPKLITRMIMRCWDARASHRPTFEELQLELSEYIINYVDTDSENSSEIITQIKRAEGISKSKGKGGVLEVD